MAFRLGDRVRIRDPQSEYFGCRGTVASEPARDLPVLGHDVAVDGENGVTRPFLVDALEPLRAVRAGSRRSRADATGDGADALGGAKGSSRPRSE